jgi:hypothetical protein
MIYNIIQERFNTVIWYEQNNVRVSFIADPANTDYAEFKKAVTAGAELQDADGVKMTAKAAKAFIATLP